MVGVFCALTSSKLDAFRTFFLLPGRNGADLILQIQQIPILTPFLASQGRPVDRAIRVPYSDFHCDPLARELLGRRKRL